MSRPTPEELRRRMTERLAAEAPRGHTMAGVDDGASVTDAASPLPVDLSLVSPTRPGSDGEPPTPAPAAVVPDEAAVQAVIASPPPTPPAAPMVAPVAQPDVAVAQPDVAVAETIAVVVQSPIPAPAIAPAVAVPTAASTLAPIVGPLDAADAPNVAATKTRPIAKQSASPLVRRNDASGRLRSHPINEAMFVEVARSRLRAGSTGKLTWDAVIQRGTDIVLKNPTSLDSLLTHIETYPEGGRRTVAATISADQDLAMQEFLLENPRFNGRRIKLEDLWAAAMLAWQRSLV